MIEVREKNNKGAIHGLLYIDWRHKAGPVYVEIRGFQKRWHPYTNSQKVEQGETGGQRPRSSVRLIFHCRKQDVLA